MVLVHGLQRVGIRRFDATKDCDKESLTHLLENFGALGDVERRLTGQANHVAGSFLPLDQMRQQVDRRLPVADEIVVDEIDGVGHSAFAQPVELGDDLLRRLEPRIAAIESRDIAEFALIGATAGILDAAEKVPFDLGELIGRNWKIGHSHAVVGLQHYLLRRPREIARQPRDQVVGRITQLADMEIVERRIVIRAGADRGAANRDGEIEPMRPAADIVHLLALDMHTTDEYRVRPFEVFLRGRTEVFVDETDRPVRRQIGRDQQQALRRHEGPDTVGQGIRVFERAERRRIARKNAQDAPHRFDAFSSHRTSSTRT